MVKASLVKTSWLILGVFFSTFTTSLESRADAQTPLKDPIAGQLTKNKWKVFDGFRSAKFGMNEKQLLRAIARDFKIPRNKVSLQMNLMEKTKTLTIRVPNLLIQGEPADIVYILGYKSKKLTMINIDWGAGVTNNFDPKKVLTSANLLRDHLMKKRYKREGFLTNARLRDDLYIVFRGRDKNDRTILLRFKKPAPQKGEDFLAARKHVSLVLSYILDVKKPDIFNGKQK